MSTIYQVFCPNIQRADLINPTKCNFVGLECEIEGVRSHGRAESLGFTVTQDGSLRNSGFEYITKAIEIPTAVEMFSKLHADLACVPEHKFSQRTSIHVHVNCANLDDNVVKNIILLYALYEEAFFLMVDAERRDNIHCVPLTETYLPSLYRENIVRLVERWHKYTALNIKPLAEYGTIEFRHMHGHADSILLNEWLGTINNLFNVAKEVTINRELLSEENMHLIFDKLFKDTQLSKQWVLVRGLMTNQIIDIKLAVM